MAKTQPQAAYSAAFTFGEISRWTYSLRVSTITSDELFQPLEEAVAKHLIPALTHQHSPGMEIRSLLVLPMYERENGNRSKSQIHRQRDNTLKWSS